ncbi:hypothetical protein E2C01_081195 [Portunus trituberculatus]|uniref:Uncharacterized protein n=1 Tax=Portunus trituberculatus TaxID=210409 RepID=A0A5B7IP66_PORTR|nr:hypothetical protein [Portunus trituberculatus]
MHYILLTLLCREVLNFIATSTASVDPPFPTPSPSHASAPNPLTTALPSLTPPSPSRPFHCTDAMITTASHYTSITPIPNYYYNTITSNNNTIINKASHYYYHYRYYNSSHISNNTTVTISTI